MNSLFLVIVSYDQLEDCIGTLQLRLLNKAPENPMGTRELKGILW